ncbi:hypothetical protein AB0P19_02250 [Microbacterium oleivorans]|uniref:hypothetical protein n=1 Tax=Microbacterium oleivorans TaxID=273677 RepID=UPI003449DBEB
MMSREQAIIEVIGMDLMICMDRCVGGCDCPAEAVEALQALGVSGEEIDAARNR